MTEDNYKRKELQSIDAGVVVIPANQKRSSVHWQKYKTANELVDQQKYDEAIAIFKTLIEIPEERETALVTLGTCYIHKGDLQNALECYNEVVTINEKNYNGLLGMGAVNYDTKHYPLAAVYYQKAIALRPELPDAYWGLAVAYHMTGNKQGASDNAKTFIQMVPDSRYRPMLEKLVID